MKYYLPMLLLFLPNNFSLFFQNQCKYYDIYLLWHFSIMYFYKLCGPSLEKASLNVLP